MPDKAKEIEERLNRLENRLKTTFLEIEKRFEQFKTEEPIMIAVEERIAEVEDLLLLLQLEITKLKEKIGTGLEFGTTPSPQADVAERLKKLEDAVYAAPAIEITQPEERTKPEIEQLLQRVSALETRKPKTDVEQKIKLSLTRELDEIEKRLDKLEHTKHAHEIRPRPEPKEARPEPKPRPETKQEPKYQSSTILADVRKILETA